VAQDNDLEELMDELHEHKSELAEKKDELNQSMEDENEKMVRSILFSIGVWIQNNLTWDMLKFAIKKALSL
jgi:hypothetical protein